VRTAPFKAVNYFTFDTILRALVRMSDGSIRGYERFLAGAGAGVTATLTCFPLDVLRTRMMSPAHDRNVSQTVWGMLMVEGLGSFYTGCLPAIVSMAIGGAVFYGTYDWLKSMYLLRQGRNPCALPPLCSAQRMRTTLSLCEGRCVSNVMMAVQCWGWAAIKL
jgi:Mitochondrial carrier protein